MPISRSASQIISVFDEVMGAHGPTPAAEQPQSPHRNGYDVFLNVIAHVLGAGGLLFGASLLAIKSVAISGGTLVIWPADGLILALMLLPSMRRPWLVFVAGLMGAMLAFSVVDYSKVDPKMILAISRVAIMALSIPGTFLLVRRFVNKGSIAETPTLLPFLMICASMAFASAFLRSLVVHALWHYPLVTLTLTTATATFTGYAFVTPLSLLLTKHGERQSDGARARLIRYSLIGVYLVGTVAACLQHRYPSLLLVPLALVLVAHAVDFVEIAFAVVATALICVGLTLLGFGPLTLFVGDLKTKILLLQAFMVIITCTTLPISALMNDHVRMKKSLLAAVNQAKSGSQAKSTFLATVSHEIRTPLNGVLGMAQVMAMDELSPAQQERLAVLRNSGEVLLALLNDVLDFSKIEAGKLTLEAIEFDLVALIDSVIRHSQGAAAEKGLALRSISDRAEGIYTGDPTRIRQILQNLVSNALKFTTTGGVTIIASYESSKLQLSVRDTGMGIPADKLNTLFQKFRQVDETTTRRFGGTGLGLSICRELTHLMGGDISVESAEGVGSTFKVAIPIERVRQARPVMQTAAQPVAAKRGRSDLRLLAAEDNPTNQMVLRALLEMAGVTATFVNNGVEAVEAWRDGRWDAILMDIQMPVMDGPTAVQKIRSAEKEEARPRTVIFALTANAMDHQIKEYLDAGMDGHLAKPIDTKALFALVAKLEGDNEQGSQTAAA
jgi:signal transduction histidine kinase/ActR/RegA family two-component response regulator